MDKYLDLEFHPLANIFPLLEGEELRALADDIVQHGLRRKIVIGDGKILDGRNRYRAAQLAKFPLTERHFTEFTGVDSLAYVISANVRRRQMNESQRALTAALLSNVKMDGCANLRMTQAECARMLNVSLRSVTDARLVLDRGPDEMIAEIEAGRMSVSLAAEELRASDPRPRSYDPPAEPPRQHEEPRIVQRGGQRYEMRTGKIGHQRQDADDGGFTRACPHLSQARAQTKCRPARKLRAVFS